MDRVIYLAMMGASQSATAQRIHANNLANASTNGFKADLAMFTSSPIKGPGYQSRISALTQNPIADYRPGAIISTGRELDIALSDEGFMAVQPDGEVEAYTRNGNLTITAEGLLTTGNNIPVLGEGGPIFIPPADRINISKDGTISILPSGSETETLVTIERIKLVRPEFNDFEKRADGLFYSKSGLVLEPDPTISVLTNSLEGSNVNLIGELVSMIENAREFETHIKMMKSAEDKDRAAANIMSSQ